MGASQWLVSSLVLAFTLTTRYIFFFLFPVTWHWHGLLGQPTGAAVEATGETAPRATLQGAGLRVGQLYPGTDTRATHHLLPCFPSQPALYLSQGLALSWSPPQLQKKKKFKGKKKSMNLVHVASRQSEKAPQLYASWSARSYIPSHRPSATESSSRGNLQRTRRPSGAAVRTRASGAPRSDGFPHDRYCHLAFMSLKHNHLRGLHVELGELSLKYELAPVCG